MVTGNDFSLMCTISGVQRNMIVLKFGGTSVGKPEHMKKIAELVLAFCPFQQFTHPGHFTDLKKLFAETIFSK